MLACTEGVSDIHPALINLPVVNIYESQHVYAVLDEGCNSTVHGSEWVADAAGKLANMGYSTRFKPEASRTFKGLSGATETLGSRTLPFSILGLSGHKGVPGVLDSHEIRGSAPLLLSLYAQAQLGVSKDLRKGTCGIRLPSEEALIEVRLCRTHDSGLLCINISEGLTKPKQPRLISEFKIPSPPVPMHKAALVAASHQARMKHVGHSAHDSEQYSTCTTHGSELHSHNTVEARNKRRISVAFPNVCLTGQAKDSSGVGGSVGADMEGRLPKKAPPDALRHPAPGATAPGAPAAGSATAPKGPPVLTSARGAPAASGQGTIPVKAAPPPKGPCIPKAAVQAKAPPPGHSPEERFLATAEANRARREARPMDTRYGSDVGPEVAAKPRSIVHPKSVAEQNRDIARYHRPGSVYNPDLELQPYYVGSVTPSLIIDVFTWGTSKDDFVRRISEEWTGNALYRDHEQMLTYKVTTGSSRTSFMVLYVDMTWLQDYELEAMTPAQRQSADDARRKNRSHVGTHPDILREYATHRNFIENAKYVLNNIKDAQEAGILQIAVHTVCMANRHRSVAGGVLIFDLVRRIECAAVSLTHMNAARSWPYMGKQSCKGQCKYCQRGTVDIVNEVAHICDMFDNAVYTDGPIRENPTLVVEPDSARLRRMRTYAELFNEQQVALGNVETPITGVGPLDQPPRPGETATQAATRMGLAGKTHTSYVAKFNPAGAFSYFHHRYGSRFRA